MNVLPNSFVANSSSTVTLITTTIPTSATISRQPSDQSDRSVILKCAACENLLYNNDGKINSYRMLAVRPTIGSGSKDPFFPILETLTHTSAVHVPCCWNCSESLLEQWNEYENKNIPIKNRVYSLSSLSSSVNNVNYDKSQSCLSTTTNMIIVDNHHNNKTLLLSSSAPIIKSRIQAHPISLSNNNNNNGNLISNSPKIDCNSNSSNSTTPSSQDEVLDLSMTSSNSTTITKNDSIPFTTKTEFVVIPSPTSLNLSTTNKIPTTNVTAVLNVSPSSIQQSNATGSRPKNTSISSSNSSSDNNVITISPYLNSSMTNLIKVSSNPVALNLKPLSTIETTFNNTNDNSSSSSPILAKKPLLSCALCEEFCPTLYSIMLRPMGNCPYFPSLTPYVKINSFDSTGKISVCESCHHQLILQWDAHQKNNKPILERQYQLVKSSSSATTKHNSLIVGQVIGQNPEASSNNIATNNTQNIINNNNTRSQNIQPISQSFVSIVAANKTFLCVMCGKDLIQNAQQNPSNNSSHIAFSIYAENDTTGNVITKKLIIQSAQEINLMPFLSQSTSMHLHQLQLLNESSRVLICGVCFESISSRCSINNNINNSDNSNIYNSSSSSSLSLQTEQNAKSINRSSHDSLNGTMTTKILTTIVNNNVSINNDDQSSLLCLACNHHKYQYLVETKENSMKKPFFPFLHDPNEPNGRARLCAPCHLMLETQWDAYENSYVPYNQRVYRLPSTTNSQSTLITTASKRSLPSSLPISSITTTTGHNISSPQTQVVNGQQSTPPPLKIQIAVPNQASLPSSSQPIVVGGNSNVNLSSDHLLLTTVQHQPAIKNVSNDLKNDQHIFKLMNELLANLGGPHPTISGTCAICHQHSPVGNTYQIFATSRNIVISAELGIYPFFPMLKLNKNNNTSNNNLKKNPKNSSPDNPYIACTFCYHSLISQWTAYQVSSKPEDRDLSSRHYNCRDFVCYVCGVTTYRQFVRSITVKDFPFLIEHKRPTGSLTINKGESVITCLTCYQTLTHQWIENERMKVPLEMRKYNWMSVPPPPPPSSSSSSSSIIKTNDQQQQKTEQKLYVLQRHSIPERTIIPILTNTSTLSYQINANSINPNGIISVPASATSDMITKAIIVNTGGGSGGIANYQPSNNNNDVQLKSITATNDNMNHTLSRTFSPSHTLAPLVAAAMAATPVTIKKENINQNNNNNSDPVINNTTTTTIIQQQPENTNNLSDVLRKLAMKQPVVLHKMQDPQIISDHQIKEYREQQQVHHDSRPSSLNLATLASVAAMASAQNQSPQLVTNKLTTHSMNENNNNNYIKQHSELPKAVINSNSFAIHFNALSDNNVGKISKKVDEQNCIRKNVITIVNNTHHNNHYTQQQHHHNHSSRAAQIRELEEVSADSNIDKSLSQVNLEVIKLRNKRIARLNKFKENQIKTENDLQSDLSDAELTEIDDNRSIFEPINFLNIKQNDHKPRRDSIVKFLAKVVPVLPLNKNAKDKADFLSNFGLTANKREREWEMFVKKKLSRRLSANSYKLDWFQENEKSILEIDPYFEQQLKYGAHFSSSDLVPDSDLLKIQQKQSIINDKNDFVNSLNLKPNSNDRQLKNEIDWLAVIRNRQFRRKCGIVCYGKIYNNLNDQVLNTWIPKLSSKSSSSSSSLFDPELIKKFERCLPLNYDLENEENSIDNDTNNNIVDENDKQSEMESSYQINKTIINQPQEKKIVVSELNHHHHQNNDIINNYQHQIVTSIALDNQKIDQCHDNAVTVINTYNNNNNNNDISNINGNNNKIINSKQFAQEFHELVLLETQKQMSKHNGSVININNNNNCVVNNNINHHHQDGANPNHNAHTIIYSEQLKQPATTILNDHLHHQNHHLSLDSNGLIIAPTIISSSLKASDKISIRDQLSKLQHRINELNREYQMCNEKKNEIILTMQKLDSEKTLCQLEFDRLSKCLDF